MFLFCLNCRYQIHCLIWPASLAVISWCHSGHSLVQLWLARPSSKCTSRKCSLSLLLMNRWLRGPSIYWAACHSLANNCRSRSRASLIIRSSVCIDIVMRLPPTLAIYYRKSSKCLLYVWFVISSYRLLIHWPRAITNVYTRNIPQHQHLHHRQRHQWHRRHFCQSPFYRERRTAATVTPWLTTHPPGNTRKPYTKNEWMHQWLIN